MNFESAQEAANRLQVNVRTIQKWAKEGKIEGAIKVGRDWMIPLNIKENIEPIMKETFEKRRFIESILNHSFELGKVNTIISNIIDKDERNLVEAEYYYYTGQREKATEIAETYLDSSNYTHRYLAALICLFSNLSLGRMQVANFALDIIKDNLYDDLKLDETDEEKAFGVFVASVASILLHLPIEGKPLLSKYVVYLPDGLKAFSSYVLALKAYTEKNYQMSYGLAKSALNIFGNQYPLPAIYLNLICGIDKMNLMELDEAEMYIRQAYALAQKDQFLEVFGEHYGMLHAYNEKIFKKEYPEVYIKLLKLLDHLVEDG